MIKTMEDVALICNADHCNRNTSRGFDMRSLATLAEMQEIYSETEGEDNG